MNKAGDFVFALVVYAMRCIEEGETERLVRMGIGAAEVEQLAALRFGDIQRMARLESHCLDIKVDRRAFADMIRRIRADGHAEEWEHRLIRADAPLDMMRSLYGTGSREYTRLRQLYEVSSTGRPREATADEETRLWPVLARAIEAAEDVVLPPLEYIAISEELGVPLRTVWRESNALNKQVEADGLRISRRRKSIPPAGASPP